MLKKNIARALVSVTLLGAGFAIAPSGYANMDDKDYKLAAEAIMKKMDTNKDGMMSKEEVMKMVSDKFDKMDSKKTGKMDSRQFEEFLKALMQSGG